MWKNYLKIAWRNILKRKGYSAINILGLAIGMAACIIIVLFITRETGFDTFHKNAERIYRVPVNAAVAGDHFEVAVNSAPCGPAMLEEIPGIETFCRVRKNGNDILLSYKDRKFYEQDYFHVDSTFFEIFSYPLLKGNPDKALSAPYEMVLTQSTVNKIFGDKNPLGKSIKMNQDRSYKVTGVVADPPANTHFRFNVLISLSSTISRMGQEHFHNSWGSLMYHTYIKLKPTVTEKRINEQLPGWYKKHANEMIEEADANFEFDFSPYLQPITDIHLHSDLFNEIETNGDIAYVYTFSAIAVFILLIAGINYMNLSTAQSIKRSREVGMRKVHGATRRQLIWQFLSESVLISFFALLIALLLVELSIPFFSQLVGYSLKIDLLNNLYILPLVLGFGILTGIVSGSYPAFYLSAFQPIKVLKKNLFRGRKQAPLSKALVMLQFVISASLIIGAVTIYRQLEYIQSKNLGYDKEHVVVIPIRNNMDKAGFESYKKELSQLAAVQSVSAAASVPGQSLSGNGFTLGDDPSEKQRIIHTITADEDFQQTLKMKMVKGRYFSKEFGTDSAAAVINEHAAKKFGWKEPIGKKIIDYNINPPLERTVIGVVEDFHYSSMRQPIEQLIIRPNIDSYNYLAVRLAPGNIRQHLRSVEEKWYEIEKAFPFDYFFLDSSLQQDYAGEQRMGQVITWFTLIALFIASLGLLGMATFNAQQRTKEIGIRKVLGATVSELVFSLVQQYSKWVIIANLIAWPLAWYFISEWLANFAYHTSIRWWFFAFSIIATLLLAIVTVSWQALKTARTNPVETLNYE